jgi:ABC-type molybdenum transport system ATPase subunit/photorepair protein PhrA
VAQIKISIPGFGDNEGESPIVILGPNGSGKTQLAQRIAQSNEVSAISAQRRTWVDDNLPVQEEQQLRNNVRELQNRWRQHSWQPTEEINFVLSTLIQDHTNLLTQRNEQAIASSQPLDPVTDTKLILLQGLWNRLFPQRKLQIGGFFPKVTRLDAPPTAPPYQLRQMSDGERTVLYMAARVLTAEQPVILVDEPELHMHSRLSVQFWDEAEKLRSDCRFVYVTHDLNFALSRRRATVLIARASDAAQPVLVDDLPSSVAAEVLGAASLPFYAKRIFLYEGESGKGFASEFFSAWFDGEETFAIPAGDRDSVSAAVSGLNAVGVVAADVIGLIDRDFYSEEVLGATTSGVTVLPLHEIESVLCDRHVVSALATHLGKEPTEVWEGFLDHVRKQFRGQTMNGVVARRVRARVGDLLDGAFSGGQVASDLAQTASSHSTRLAGLDLPAKTEVMFAEESKRVADALAAGGTDMLKILPGKHMLSILVGVLGFSGAVDLTSLVVRSLNRKLLKAGDPLLALGAKLEAALLAYLPSREV